MRTCSLTLHAAHEALSSPEIEALSLISGCEETIKGHMQSIFNNDVKRGINGLHPFLLVTGRIKAELLD